MSAVGSQQSTVYSVQFTVYRFWMGFAHTRILVYSVQFTVYRFWMGFAHTRILVYSVQFTVYRFWMGSIIRHKAQLRSLTAE